MNKNVIFLAIAAMLIGAGVAVLVAQQGGNDAGVPTEETVTTQTEDEEEPQQLEDEVSIAENNVVSYTDDGFSPAQTTIQAGETITFENSSSFDLWVASDEHPAHTDLPGFDAGAGIVTGETYTFTFNEPGEWGYHNHLQAGQTGTIIVE